MKDLRGSATGDTSARADECVRLLRAVDRYPAWHPEVVRQVEVLERDASGEPNRVRCVLHAALGPIVRDFDLVLAITLPDPRTVKLSRLPNDPGDDERFEVVWHLDPTASTTRLGLELEASLSVPRLVPVGGIGDRLAEGFVAAATRALDT